jgi:integrase
MNGEKIFSITTKQLRDFYLQYEQERTDSEQISVGRLSNIKTHTKHYLDFLGTTLRIQNISKTKFREYRGFRQKQKTDITMNAVMNELITIKKMYDFGRKNGYISNNYEIDYGEIRVRNDETKRDGYTIGEYRQLTGISKFWNTKVKSGQLNYEEEIYYRKLIHYFILCMSNFGFRTNELRLLQWKEVNIHDDETVSITILRDNTKVRKQRRVDGNRGIIFKKIKSFSKYTDRNDYVFSHFRENKVLDKTLLYDYYKKLILSVKEKHEDFDTSKTLYSLRHFYITLHLLVGKVDVYSIAHYTGTSLTQIEKHYSHIKDIEVSRKMMKTELKFGKNDEIILEDDLDITEKKRKIINS